MTYGHLQADCLYTGISSGPNARCRVWEAFTFTFFTSVHRFTRVELAARQGNSHITGTWLAPRGVNMPPGSQTGQLLSCQSDTYVVQYLLVDDV